MRKTKAVVVLSNGEHFVGEAFGASGRAIGEVVFNTSMSGYQEILTDPSYRGQLVTMTAPHIGNYGVNPVDVESDRVQVAGFIVREASRVCSNFRATATLQDYLAEQGVVGITGVDTRALTRRIRDAGAVMGAVVHDAGPADVPGIVEEILAAPEYGTVDYVGEVSVDAPRRASLVATNDPFVPRQVALSDDDGPWPAEDTDKPWVAVLDFGVKHSILRHLLEQGMRVTLFPHDTDPDRLLALRPAGVLLSNGPGDPGQMDADVGRVSAIVGRVPIFGICLGHQLLSRALGARTFKLKFGHRGPNQPVLEKATGRVQITSQNHGYAVSLDGLAEDIQVTYVNLNDQTIEGLAVPHKRAFSVQHHPEAGPGPHDAAVMFERFREAIAD